MIKEKYWINCGILVNQSNFKTYTYIRKDLFSLKSDAKAFRDRVLSIQVTISIPKNCVCILF